MQLQQMQKLGGCLLQNIPLTSFGEWRREREREEKKPVLNTKGKFRIVFIASEKEVFAGNGGFSPFPK